MSGVPWDVLKGAGAGAVEACEIAVRQCPDERRYRYQAQAADLQLKGATEILSWRGEHPWSKAKMQVVAVAWSQRWAADAGAVGRAMGAAEQRMKQQGGLPAAPAAADGTAGGAPAAAPVKAGAAASTSDL